jgi:hypothetical protein
MGLARSCSTLASASARRRFSLRSSAWVSDWTSGGAALGAKMTSRGVDAPLIRDGTLILAQVVPQLGKHLGQPEFGGQTRNTWSARNHGSAAR